MAYHIGDTPFAPSTGKIIQNFSNFQYYRITKKEKKEKSLHLGIWLNSLDV